MNEIKSVVMDTNKGYSNIVHVDNESLFVSEHYITKNSALHIHECFEVEFLLSGKAKTRINNKIFFIQDGSFWISKPNDIHTFYDIEENCVVLSIKFNYDFLSSDIFFRIGKQNNEIEGSFSPDEFEWFINSFNAFISQFNSIKNNEKIIFSKNYINYLVMYLYIIQGGDSTDCINVDQKFFLEVYPYILDNFTKKLTVKEISKKYNYNSDYFSYKFKQIFGINFIEFINIHRLKLAAFLLSVNKYSVPEIVEMVGFESVSYFYKKFKEMYGTSPKSGTKYKK